MSTSFLTQEDLHFHNHTKLSILKAVGFYKCMGLLFPSCCYQSEQNHHSLLETQNMKSDTCVALAQLDIDRETWGKAHKFPVCDL